MTYIRATRGAGIIGDIGQYVDIELIKIETEFREPEVRGLTFEKLSAIPAKYAAGDLYYGIANVFGPQEGLYINDGGTNWRRL